MNIEDSIKTLKEFNRIKINSYAMQFVNISYPDLQEAIETLLSAYKKEKEKNKELEKKLEELKNGQIDFWISDKEIEERIRNKFVSKDKIKAKIEEIEKGNKRYFIRGEKILVLQSLLEEEE